MDFAEVKNVPMTGVIESSISASVADEMREIADRLQVEYPTHAPAKIEAAVDFASKIAKTRVYDDRFARIARLYLSICNIQ